MAEFSPAIKYVLENEVIDYGGPNQKSFVDNKKDPGGPTNWGITLTSYADYLGRDTSVEELLSITDADARSFYLNKLWTPNSFPLIEQQGMATAIFDMYVNMGHRAIKLAQTICGGFEPIIIDGFMGEETVLALNKIENDFFLDEFSLALEEHYKGICSRDIVQVVFLSGWLKRAYRVLILKTELNE